jgi:ABC-2 type transport system permease protein
VSGAGDATLFRFPADDEVPPAVLLGLSPPVRRRVRRLDVVADTLVFGWRRGRHLREIPEKLLDVTLQPLMFVLLFTYVFGNAISIGGPSFREYIVAGILIQSLAFGLSAPATSIATDLTEGVIDRFRSLPASRTAYLLGHVLAELGGMILSIVVLLGAGLVVGWRVHSDAGQVVVGVGLLVLFALAMVWVGTALGLLVRSPDAVMGVAFTVVLPLAFLSTAFVPMAALPDVLQVIAAWNPASVMVTAVRALFGNPNAPFTHQPWPLEHPVRASFAYCALLLAVAVPAASWRFRRRTRD